MRLWLRFLLGQGWKSSLHKSLLFFQTGWLLVTGQELWSAVGSAFCLVLGFVVVVRSLSLFSLFVTSWTETCQATLSSTILLELAQIHIHWVGDANLFFCCLIVILPSIYPSIRVFSASLLFTPGAQRNGASATVLPINIQHWFTLGLASLREICSSRDSQKSSLAPQFKNINYLFSAFFMVQFSHPYMTTGKKHSFDCTDIVGKVMSLLFNMQSRFVKAFFPQGTSVF